MRGVLFWVHCSTKSETSVMSPCRAKFSRGMSFLCPLASRGPKLLPVATSEKRQGRCPGDGRRRDE